LNRDLTIELVKALQEKKKRQEESIFFQMYPDEGPLRRELYPKHLEFFDATSKYNEVAAISGNRTGKTFGCGAYSVTAHTTGLYPEWWTGKRFDRPITCWVSGATGKTVRDILQETLLGDKFNIGTGMIPKNCIEGQPPSMPGVPGAFEMVYVKHVSGGLSRIFFKSYEQGPKAYMGTAIDLSWIDEEASDINVYSQNVVRTMTTDGLVISTFTPENGLSDTLLMFMPDGLMPDNGIVPSAIAGKKSVKYVVNITWDDVPHLSEEEKDKQLASCPPHLRDVKSKGLPQVGSGVIYPLLEDSIVVEPFEIPSHWPRMYGFDPGWNQTAAVWGAIDPETDVVYLYSEHYRSKAEHSIHADAIKARGEWIPGVIDYAGKIDDGTKIMHHYEEMGLLVYRADKSVDAGIEVMWQRLSAGRLKVMTHLKNWLKEVRMYRRDDKGRIVKKHDHLMDATRYMVMSLDVARIYEEDEDGFYEETFDSSRNTTTGY